MSELDNYLFDGRKQYFDQILKRWNHYIRSKKYNPASKRADIPHEDLAFLITECKRIYIDGRPSTR